MLILLLPTNIGKCLRCHAFGHLARDCDRFAPHERVTIVRAYRVGLLAKAGPERVAEAIPSREAGWQRVGRRD